MRECLLLSKWKVDVEFDKATIVVKKCRMTGVCDEEVMKGLGIPDSLDQARKLASPRVLKSHLPIEMLPRGIMKEKKAKVGYILMINSV